VDVVDLIPRLWEARQQGDHAHAWLNEGVCSVEVAFA
jgi:hypothetical protein